MIAGHVLRSAFLLATRAASWLRLSWRDEAWKNAEILILRHQLTVLQCDQPCLWGSKNMPLVLSWAFRRPARIR